TPVSQLSLRPLLNAEVPSRIPMNSNQRSFSVRPPVRVDVDAPSIAPKRVQVIVRVRDVVARAAIPDFEIDDIAFATVDEMVPVRFSLGNPGGHARPEHRLSGVRYQSR